MEALEMKRSQSWLVFAVSAALAGCTSVPKEKAQPQPSHSEESPLYFEVADAAGQPRRLHTAFLEGSFAGQPARFIVDSGASDHVFTRPTMKFDSAQLVEEKPGTDHSGNQVKTWRLRRSEELSLSGLGAFSIENALVIDGPPPFEGWQIGAILSPQQLARRYAVLDFQRGVLRLEDNEPIGCPDGLFLVTLKSVVATGDQSRLPIARAEYEGTPIRLLINTGGKHFEISPRVYEGDVGAVRATGQGVGGASVDGAAGETGLLRLGGRQIQIETPVVREQLESVDAQIGMPHLSRSVLWLPRSQRDDIYVCLMP